MRTIVYFDIFDFSPTIHELDRYLLRVADREPYEHIALTELQHAVSACPQIDTHNGFLFLKNRAMLPKQRCKKYKETETRRKRARWLLRLCAIMPGVRAVWLANSVSWGNARDISDTDIVVITKPDALWTARFATTALFKILRQRPGEQERRKALCFSFYLTDTNMNLEQYKINANDIHFPFWVAQMYPLYDSGTQNPALGAYYSFQQQNQWVHEIFQHNPWAEPTERFWIIQSFVEQWMKKMLEMITRLFHVEQWLKKLQLRIMPAVIRNAAKHHCNVVINDTILKLHSDDPRAQLQQIWEERCRAFL